jgi:hypothetical protein
MKRALRKLRTTSFDELIVRGSQYLSAFAERQAWSGPAKLISDDELLERIDITQLGKAASPPAQSALNLRDHFRERRSPHFFPAFDDPASTVAQFRRRWPELQKKIVERAEKIVEGRFDLLGLRDLSFGNPVDWHLEPLAGKSSPLVHWSRLDYLNAELFGDKKIVWELNRHQYFAVLGQAYWLTGDERYAQAFAAHIDSWMDQNPPKLGINWASSLEVAFRSISWLWALYFFKNSGALTSELFARICKFLYVNARHLETYPSTYFSPNTHLTGEALGLFYLGTALPEFKESARWRDNALSVLLAQLSRHVLPDGVYFEQSSYYHRYTTDFYLHLSILLRANRHRASPEINDKLRLLLDHLLYITRPDGTTPLFGDDDGGRLLPLDDRSANDFRSTLATGGALFGRPHYKFVSGGASPETLWLLGPAGLETLDRISDREPPHQSIAFAAGGYYVMRDGWKPDSNYLLFDCGPHGIDNCGHAHADALSYELSVNGRTLLVDPGTYTYTGASEVRDWFRSSAAHNTLSVDGESSSASAGPFSWKSIAHGRCLSWISEPRFDYVVAAHDGFKRLQIPLIHTRSILFLKRDYWIVHDRVESEGAHALQFWLHFDSRGGTTTPKAHIAGNTIECPQLCRILTFARNGGWTEEASWVSHCYGMKEPAPAFSFSVRSEGSEDFITLLFPEVSGEAAPLAKEIPAVAGKAFEINFRGKRDVLLLRNVQGKPERVEIPRIASDFAVCWVRFNSEGPEEFVLIGGEMFELDGRRLETGRSGSTGFCYVRN